MVQNEPVNKKAGMAASFLALARKKIRCGGRLGFVLPLTAAFADTWQRTRQMVERDFEDIIALSIAGGGESLSADTGMEEMLLIATKSEHQDSNNSSAKPQTIRCVVLRDTPIRVGEAGEIARAITKTVDRVGSSNGKILPIHVGGEELGHVIRLD